MTAVLGIDAAWTKGQPSGVALVRGKGSDWKCVAVAPGYESFIALADRKPVDWTRKPVGGKPEVERLLSACRKILGGEWVDVVAVDMPLSLKLIRGRREADQEISKTFGKYHCSVHSPSAQRPGRISDQMREGFAHSIPVYPLAAREVPGGTSPSLLEVYPHTALLKLLGAEDRIPYKVSKTTKYWPGRSMEIRRRNILGEWRRILGALGKVIRGIKLTPGGPGLSSLKRYEDALDSLICAWVGIEFLAGRAEPYGDKTASIWTPMPLKGN